MNQFTGDNTRAMSAFCTVNSIERMVGEGVTVRDVAVALDVTKATARKWLKKAVERGLVKFKVRNVMGAAVEYVYFGMFSSTFATLTEFEHTEVILSVDQKSVLGMNVQKKEKKTMPERKLPAYDGYTMKSYDYEILMCDECEVETDHTTMLWAKEDEEGNEITMKTKFCYECARESEDV